MQKLKSKNVPLVPKLKKYYKYSPFDFSLWFFVYKSLRKDFLICIRPEDNRGCYNANYVMGYLYSGSTQRISLQIVLSRRLYPDIIGFIYCIMASIQWPRMFQMLYRVHTCDDKAYSTKLYFPWSLAMLSSKWETGLYMEREVYFRKTVANVSKH